MPHRCMMARRHQKADPGLGKGARDKCHLAVKIDPETDTNIWQRRFSMIRPDCHVWRQECRSRRRQRRWRWRYCGADAIAASADNIHGAVRRVNEAGLGAHDAGGGGDILDTLTAYLQRNKKGRHLDLADLAIHDGVKTTPDRVRGGMSPSISIFSGARIIRHCRESRAMGRAGRI